ncbi:fimbrial protein [Pseudomonas serboccidentalis]|uniref:fimbrial protein n=1 Tax=Pseudomonas serboccidentalis TaxID=2964670 RepID=UPI0039DF7C3F
MKQQLALTVLLALMLPQAMLRAAENMHLHGTLVEPPACVINGDQPIDVDFGKEVMTTRVDGTNYRQPLRYSLECADGVPTALKLQIQGSGAGFDKEALLTNKGDLGIALLSNGSRFPLNTWVNMTYPNTPQLQAVPIKRDGSTLTGGDFSAGATMMVDYQ